MPLDQASANESTNAGAPFPSGGREELARRRLRHNRVLATGLLGLMGATFFGTHMVDDPGFATLLVRSGAEAGVVGGLADWFAVTALFRRPMGLPIPHTAIIPNSKDRIGQAIGRFVERNFLTEEAILSKVRQSHPTRRLATWTTNPEVAAAMAGTVVAAMPYAIRSLENQDLHDFVNRTLGEQFREADIASVLGRAIDLVSASGEADVLFERAIGIAARWLEENRSRFDELVQERSRWWIPKTINRRIAAAISKGILNLLNELRQEDSNARMQFREALSGLVDELLNSPEQREQLNAAKNRLLDHPDIKAWFAVIWHDVSQATLNDLSQPTSRTRLGLEKAILAIGQAVGSDPAMQRHIDSVVERTVRHLVSWRSEIGVFIAEVVSSWDARALSDRLELVVGSDLQYIRMNGTIVGAIVGCLLFLLVHVFF
jgi:uncharacterized membrane-anchored protein YjiN (DUF445 family)